METKKLYAVTFTKTMYVIADDETDAEIVAEEFLSEDDGPMEEVGVHHLSGKHLDEDVLTYIPWADPVDHDKRDWTIQEWLDYLGKERNENDF